MEQLECVCYRCPHANQITEVHFHLKKYSEIEPWVDYLEFSIKEAARIRGVSERRMAQQAKEGGWGVRKVARGRYVLSDHESSDFKHECADLESPEGRLALEEMLRTELEQTDQFQRRAMLICILAELELDRVSSIVQGPEFGNEDRPLNKTELDWLLNS